MKLVRPPEFVVGVTSSDPSSPSAPRYCYPRSCKQHRPPRLSSSRPASPQGLFGNTFDPNILVNVFLGISDGRAGGESRSILEPFNSISRPLHNPLI